MINFLNFQLAKREGLHRVAPLADDRLKYASPSISRRLTSNEVKYRCGLIVNFEDSTIVPSYEAKASKYVLNIIKKLQALGYTWKSEPLANTDEIIF